MSTPNDTQAQDTLAAPTLAEVVQAARRKGNSEQPGRRQQQGEPQSQITTRELNPFNTNKDEGGQKIERTVVQGKDDQDAAGGDLRKASSFLGKRLFGERFSSKVSDDGKQIEGDPDKGTEKTDDGKPKGRTPAAGKADAGKPASPDDKPKITVKQKPSMSAEQIATIAANAAVETVNRLGDREEKRVEKTQDAPDLSYLTEDDKEDLEVMKKMAEMYPERYKSLPDQMMNAAKERRAYAAKFEAENPGKKIDWSDSEHSSFLSSVEPAYDARHFRKAEASIVADAAVENVKLQHAEELAEIRRATVTGSIKDTVRAESVRAVKTFQSELAPEAEWDLTTPEGRQKAAVDDPILGPIAARHASNLEVLISEATQIYDSKGTIKIEPDKKPAHRVLVEIADEWENVMSSKSPEDTANDKGQIFVDRATYRKMNEKERKGFWTILRNEMLFFINLTVKKQAEKERDAELSRLEAISKKQGWRFDRESIVTQKRRARSNPDGIDEEGDRATAAGRNLRQEAQEEDPAPAATEVRNDGGGAGGDGSDSAWAKDLVKRLFPRDTVSPAK